MCETISPEVDADDFARRFSLRSSNLMWMLGAGSSAPAGIPTAGDMIWDFKQTLFVSQRRVSPKMVADLSSPAIRVQLQAHIDSSGRLPQAGAADEYAALFEAVYPAEADRRIYLESKMRGAKPSYGHLALATFMRAQLTRLVWDDKLRSPDRRCLRQGLRRHRPFDDSRSGCTRPRQTVHRRRQMARGSEAPR